MKASEEIKTLAKTIIWMARKRLEHNKFQNLNSAIHAITVELQNELMLFMRDEK